MKPKFQKLRRYVLAHATLFVAMLGGIFPATVAGQSDAQKLQGWPLFRGDAGSTGVASSELPKELETLWEFKVPNGAFEGTATIVAANDPLKPEAKLVLIADLDGTLFALDLESGDKRWEFKSEAGFVTSPSVNSNRIFIGDLDGRMVCLDLTGKLVWEYATDGEINSSANFYDGKVIVGSQDAHLYALDAETGKLVWKFESQDQIRCSITVADDRAFVAGCDGFFHVMDLKTGNQIGKTDIGGPTGSTPALLGDVVYFGSESGSLFAVDWRKIENKWVVTPQESGNSIIGSAAVTEEAVIFGARNRTVYALSPQTGEEKWSTRVKGKIDGSPVIVGERIFIASTDGRMYALSLSDGTIQWEKQFNGGFVASPAVAFHRMVIATNRGVVYGLGGKK